MDGAKKHPYQNCSLSNLPGEIWKDIDSWTDLYQVSSYGRIKSLRRLIEVTTSHKDAISYWIKERVRKIKVHERWNQVIGKPYFECTIALIRAGKESNFLVHRLVYQAFVNPIDFDVDRLMVMHKDGNGLNNQYNNLEAVCREEVSKKAYRLKRAISPFALKTKKEFKKISQKSSRSRQKKISQYSSEGNKIQVYNSIKDASQRTGIAGSNLVRVLKGRQLTASGFIWRYNSGRKKIDTSYIQKRKEANIKRSRKAVKQCSPKGKLLKTFKSIQEAANQTKLSHSIISNCLTGRIKWAGGYVWKYKK